MNEYRGILFAPNGKCPIKGRPGEQPSICADILRSCHQLGSEEYCNLAAKRAEKIIAGMVITDRYVGD